MPTAGATNAVKAAVASATDADFICGRDTSSSYTFCAPRKAGGDFYIGIVSGFSTSKGNDIPLIKGLFGTPACRPEAVTQPPAGTPMPKDARAYKVSTCVSRFVDDHATKEATRVGPNCYGTALAAVGYEKARDRYVDGEEFVYYLTRDFRQIPCASSGPYGNIVVYDRRSTSFDHGAHAAYELPGQLVLHKGDWKTNYPWEIVAMNGAMQAILSHYVPTGNDRFDPPPDPADYEGYNTACYTQKGGLHTQPTSSTQRDSSWFLPLMDYYARRLSDASKLAWGEFKSKRVDLLTIENMWRVLREFSGRPGGVSTKALLGISSGIAETYLELKSLDDQYQAMAGIYAPISDRHRKEELEELYRMHYVTIDQDFDRELNLYFGLLGVPQASRAAVRNDFLARLKRDDPVKHASSDGAEGFPYLEELTRSIRAIVKNWKPPAY